MARIWSDAQLERATTPQARDIRGKAFLSAINRMLGERPLPGPHMRDPETCPAEVLPALVAEYSMEEFIEPGLPAHVVRRILQNRWALQSLEGKDAGVKLWLSLLGADVTITQWYQMQPKGAANTHRINCMIEDALWPVEEGRFGPRQISAMWRMINRTKRFSQDTELRIGVSAKGKAFIGIYLGTSMRATAPAIIPPPPIVTLPAAQALVPTALLAATARTLP